MNLTLKQMNKHFTYLLAVCLLLISSFTNKGPATYSPDQIARSVFKSLLESNATTFATTYDIDVPDLKWYKKRIEADTFIAPETKEDFVEEFTAYMHNANKALPNDFKTKWEDYLTTNGIKKDGIKYIDSYYIQTNKKLGIPAIGLEIKFLYKGSYHYVDIDLLEINNQWKGVTITTTTACDKYFDGY